MSYKFKWLQFFADGAAGSGEGGEGAATGVETGAADRTLEDLGVPKDKAERFRQRRGKKNAPAAEPVQAEPAAPQEAPANPSWDDFMQIPENQQRLQAMMADRGKKATEAKNAAEATMSKLNPALELLAARYGVEAKDGQYDVDAITNAILEDDGFYEKKAEELGVDVEVAKQLENANRERRLAEAREQALIQERQKQERDFELQQHFNRMRQEATQLREVFPDFDLNRELQDPVFLQRTAPGSGMSVKDAYYSIHHDEIMEKHAEVIAKKAKADAAASIRSGVRPRENGSSATAAVSATPDLKHMTREDRLAYIKAKYPSG